MTLQQIAKDTCIVRDTAARKGRTIAVAPGTAASRFLHYGRIILDAGEPSAQLCHQRHGDRPDRLERIGRGEDEPIRSQSFTIGRYDSLYVPRGASIEITPGPDGCDLAEVAAPVDREYPVQFVAFKTVQADPGLHLKVGGPSAKRDLNILIGKNVEAGRIMAGVTFSDPGTGHPGRRTSTRRCSRKPISTSTCPRRPLDCSSCTPTRRNRRLATIVREGDVVLMPQGYHPNVAAPGGSINFLWMMAANREREDRQYGVVNVQPEFAATPSGLDKGR